VCLKGKKQRITFFFREKTRREKRRRRWRKK
jgi:hypothetical protein